MIWAVLLSEKKKTEFRILASSLDITKFFFEIRVRQGNRCTWWVTCNFNQRKETTNATEMTHRFSSILCYDLICSCNKVKRTTEFRILASSLDITVSTFSCYYSQARPSALRPPPPAQDSVNYFIIGKLSPLVVVDFRWFISSFLYA